jgi:hypothetical protein
VAGGVRVPEAEEENGGEGKVNRGNQAGNIRFHGS